MRPIFRAATAAALLLAGACASTPSAQTAAVPASAPAAASSAAGKYGFASVFRGEPFEGNVTLVRSAAGELTGTVTTPFTGAMPVTAVVAEGNRVRVTAKGDLGDAVLTFEMNGSSFRGNWSYGPATGEMMGVKEAS